MSGLPILLSFRFPDDFGLGVFIAKILQRLLARKTLRTKNEELLFATPRDNVFPTV